MLLNLGKWNTMSTKQEKVALNKVAEKLNSDNLKLSNSSKNSC